MFDNSFEDAESLVLKIITHLFIYLHSLPLPYTRKQLMSKAEAFLVSAACQGCACVKSRGLPLVSTASQTFSSGGSKRHRPALETSCYQGEASWHRLRLESEMRPRIGVRKPDGADLPSQRTPLT